MGPPGKVVDLGDYLPRLQVVTARAPPPQPPTGSRFYGKREAEAARQYPATATARPIQVQTQTAPTVNVVDLGDYLPRLQVVTTRVSPPPLPTGSRFYGKRE